jgi:hypothetical protein
MVTVDVKIGHDTHTATLSREQAAREIEAFLNRTEAASRREWLARVTKTDNKQEVDNPTGIESLPVENKPSIQHKQTQTPKPATQLDPDRKVDPGKTWDFGTPWI